jgi:hypothetical protein
MPERLTPAQAQNIVEIFRRFLQDLVQPLDLEFSAFGALLNAIRQTNPDVAEGLDAQLAVFTKLARSSKVNASKI